MNGPKLPFVAGLVAAVQLPQSRPLSLPQHLSASMTAQRDKLPLVLFSTMSALVGST